jgi:vacuolar protein sorting-associated protein IST1
MLNSIKDTFSVYQENRLKSHMKMGLQRVKMEVNKQTNITKHQKKEIATLLQEGKVELARIKCEHIVRTDEMIEAYGIIELYLELLSERIHYISTSPKDALPPSDIREPISSLVFAAKRVQINELQIVAQQIQFKFGDKFAAHAALNIEEATSNERLVKKLSMDPVTVKLINGYMTEIASTYGVEYVFCSMFFLLFLVCDLSLLVSISI